MGNSWVSKKNTQHNNINASYNLLQVLLSGSEKIIVINFEIFHCLYLLILPRLVVKTLEWHFATPLHIILILCVKQQNIILCFFAIDKMCIDVLHEWLLDHKHFILGPRKKLALLDVSLCFF